MHNDAKKQEIIKAITNNIECAPVIKKTELNLNEYAKIPFAELGMLGAGLSSLPASLRTITQNVTTPETGLYRINMNGKVGTLVTKNGSTLGNMVGADGHTFSGRAVFTEVNDSVSTVSTSVPFDPTLLMTAMVLVYINQKLDTIQETQQEILEFLRMDKRSKLEGNINFLMDVFNDYKYNWNDATYKANVHVKVLDIRQDSEQSINFSQKLIADQAQKRRNNVNTKLKALISEFENYQLSLYMYGFSSFLEIMLLENFDKNYLENIVHKIENRSYQYRELYTNCYDLLENAAKKSMESILLGGLAKVSGAVGSTVARMPIISKSQIDENLIRAKSQLENVKEMRTEKTMMQFINSKNNYVYPFIQALNTINKLYNQPHIAFLDKENLYLSL